MDSFRLTKKELQVLSIVERDGDALLFDLEVQELTRRGFIDDLAGTLVLTNRGRKALQFIVAESCPEQAACYAIPAPTESKPHW